MTVRPACVCAQAAPMSASADMLRVQPALGIADVNTRPLMRAADPLIGIAGNWGSTLRPRMAGVLEPNAVISKPRLGDQPALHGAERACLFLDYTYVSCRDRATGRMRYRPGFREMCAPPT